ncbi:MAG: hypothetical protein ACRC1T_17600 [Clostridium chrysemydis]|uniref:hypothetical protein n=1 Tax=Clostridium chrysemydis TaxID=2665504 RepID=UPI003F415294
MIIKKNLLGKELSFEMTNRTYLNLDDKYGNAGAIVNSVCYGVKAYDDENKKPINFGKDGFVNNSLKLLAESCFEEITIEDLEENLTPGELLTDAGNTAVELYLDYMGVRPKKDSPEEEAENVKKN